MSVQTLTTSMQTTFPSPNGWAKTKPSDGYTVKPAAHVSASDKAHLCNIRSCHKPMLYALSNVSAMAVLLGEDMTEEEREKLMAEAQLLLTSL